jgi:hypothetical protein
MNLYEAAINPDPSISAEAVRLMQQCSTVSAQYHALANVLSVKACRKELLSATGGFEMILSKKQYSLKSSKLFTEGQHPYIARDLKSTIDSVIDFLGKVSGIPPAKEVVVILSFIPGAVNAIIVTDWQLRTAQNDKKFKRSMKFVNCDKWLLINSGPDINDVCRPAVNVKAEAIGLRVTNDLEQLIGQPMLDMMTFETLSTEHFRLKVPFTSEWHELSEELACWQFTTTDNIKREVEFCSNFLLTVLDKEVSLRSLKTADVIKRATTVVNVVRMSITQKLNWPTTSFGKVFVDILADADSVATDFNIRVLLTIPWTRALAQHAISIKTISPHIKDVSFESGEKFDPVVILASRRRVL